MKHAKNTTGIAASIGEFYKQQSSLVTKDNRKYWKDDNSDDVPYM